MAKQTIRVQNLGEHGYLPDVRPSNLPLNAFSYSRNWRFSEAGHASVTNGYSNAFENRNLTEFGDSDTSISFIYTWLLDNENAIVYYDSANNKMKMIETDVNTSNLAEYDLSKSGVWSGTFTRVSLSDEAGEWHQVTDTESVFFFEDSEAAIAFQTAASANAQIEVHGATADVNVDYSHTAEVISSTRDTERVTVIVDSLPFGVVVGTVATVSVGTPFVHEADSKNVWQATDAFGVPIFVNPHEAPWYLIDDTVPYIEELDNWPSGATTRTMVKFNAFLFSIGYERDTDDVALKGSNRTIAISDVIVTPGTLPKWDFDNSESFSQIFDLSLFTDSRLVGAIESNNILYIFSETDTIAMTYDGDGVFSATRLPIGGGTLATKTVAAIPNGRFHIGNGRMYIEDGNTYQEIGEGKWVDSWFTAVDEARIDEIQVLYDPRSHSVWIKTPTSEIEQEMWIYNLDNDTVSPLDDHGEIGYLSWSAEGVPSKTLTWDSLDTDLTWDTLTENSWNDFPVSDLGEYRNRLISGGGRSVFVHDLGFTFNGRDINAVLQREGVPAQQDSYHSYCIERVIPWLRADDGVMTDVRVGGANSQDRATNWTPYKTWVTGTTQKLDFRRQAKWGGVTFRSDNSDTILTGYEIDVSPQNRR